MDENQMDENRIGALDQNRLDENRLDENWVHVEKDLNYKYRPVHISVGTEQATDAARRFKLRAGSMFKPPQAYKLICVQLDKFGRFVGLINPKFATLPICSSFVKTGVRPLFLQETHKTDIFQRTISKPPKIILCASYNSDSRPTFRPTTFRPTPFPPKLFVQSISSNPNQS